MPKVNDAKDILQMLAWLAKATVVVPVLVDGKPYFLGYSHDGSLVFYEDEFN